MIVTAVPSFIYRAIAHRNFGLLALTLDLAIPPLSLLVIMLVAMSSMGVLAVLFGASSAALIISATCLIALALAISLSWLMFGRDLLPIHAFFSVVWYILAKLPIYRQLVSRNSSPQWTRTDRSKKE